MGYVIWGVVHGWVSLYTNGDGQQKKRIDHSPSSSALRSLVGCTPFPITLSRIVFRLDLEHAWNYYTRMLNPFAEGLPISWEQVLLILCTFAINLWGPSIFQQLSSSLEKPQTTLSITGYVILFVCATLALFSMMPSGVPPYLYARF